MSMALVVDGSKGEGGGQVLRSAVALAAVTARAVRVVNIRVRRPNPGLAAQHVAAVGGVAALCGAEVEGLAVGSRSLEFRPRGLKGGRVEVDVGTAGSVTLVLQACLPAALMASGPSELNLRGGTDVPWAPPADYLLQVFLPLLQRTGARVEVEVLRRGYAPKGGGSLRARVQPHGDLRGLDLPGGDGGVEAIRGIAHASNLPGHIPRRMKQAALGALGGYEEVAVEERVLGPKEAQGPGGGVVLWALARGSILGSDALARRGIPAEEVGEAAARALVLEMESGATLDVRAADQLIPYMALARRPSTFLVRALEGHLRTQMDLLKEFLGCRIEVEEVGRLFRVGVHPSPTAP